jgi:hypothetical protein
MSSEKIVTISWFDRLKQSVGGMAFGFMLICAMVMVLFWNEGRAVQTARSLAEGAGLVKSVASNSVNTANEGALVHIAGQLTTSEVVTDAKFGVSASGLSLARKVEMYQWVEKKTTEKKVELGGSETQVTQFSYERQWSDREQESQGFNEPEQHQNAAFQYKRDLFSVTSAKLDAWTLGAPVLSRVGGQKPLLVAAEDQRKIQSLVGNAMAAHVVEGIIYLSYSPSNPSIGDYRISYQYVPLDTVSVIGQQSGDGIRAYATDSGDDLLMVENGNVPAQAMFKSAASANSTMGWIIRAVGIAAMILGFRAILGPISVAASVLPFLGSILAMGTGIIAIIAGLGLSSLTIAIAWFFYRPLVTIIILAIAGAIIGGLLYLSKTKKAKAAPAVQA